MNIYSASTQLGLPKISLMCQTVWGPSQKVWSVLHTFRDQCWNVGRTNHAH